MNPCYAYSFDRETFTGCFPSREKAIAGAIEQCRLDGTSPPTVFVGQVVPPDPHAAGNAEDVLDNMRRRFHIDVGEEGRSWLKNLAREQVEELDGDLNAAITAWLMRHDLMPAQSRVRSISEHTLPSHPAVASGSDDEVHDVGPSFL